MARTRSTKQVRARRKKVIKQASGYFGHKSIGWKSAQEQVRQSKKYSFRDRKQTKRNFRSIWIKRLNAAARIYDISYSDLINGLKLANIEVNRKILSMIAIEDIKQFEIFVNEAKAALAARPKVENPTNHKNANSRANSLSKISQQPKKTNTRFKGDNQKVKPLGVKKGVLKNRY